MEPGEHTFLVRRRARRADRSDPRAFLVLLLAVFVLAACLVTVGLDDTRVHAVVENDGAPWRPYRYRVDYLPQAAGATASALLVLVHLTSASSSSAAAFVGEASLVGAHVAAHLAACRHATWLAVLMTMALTVHACLMEGEKKNRVLELVVRAVVWVPVAWDARNDIDYLVGILLGGAFLAAAVRLPAVACLLLSLVAPWRGVELTIKY